MNEKKDEEGAGERESGRAGEREKGFYRSLFIFWHSRKKICQ
jgi:hypothetical protein